MSVTGRNLLEAINTFFNSSGGHGSVLSLINVVTDKGGMMQQIFRGAIPPFSIGPEYFKSLYVFNFIRVISLECLRNVEPGALQPPLASRWFSNVKILSLTATLVTSHPYASVTARTAEFLYMCSEALNWQNSAEIPLLGRRNLHKGLLYRTCEAVKISSYFTNKFFGFLRWTGYRSERTNTILSASILAYAVSNVFCYFLKELLKAMHRSSYTEGSDWISLSDDSYPPDSPDSSAECCKPPPPIVPPLRILPHTEPGAATRPPFTCAATPPPLSSPGEPLRHEIPPHCGALPPDVMPPRPEHEARRVAASALERLANVARQLAQAVSALTMDDAASDVTAAGLSPRLPG